MNGPGLLTLHQLLACGGALLVVLGVSSWLLLREDKAARQLADRLDTVSNGYARANPLQSALRQKVEQPGSAKVWNVLAGLFGYDLARVIYYPTKVPVVLVVALVLAVVLSHLVSTLFGPVARLAIPVLWLGISRRAFTTFEARRAAKLYNQFPDALAACRT